MHTPSEIKTRLFSLVNKGIKYDLDRMFKATSLCGDPQKSYRSVHVAGTNGKGSTCAFIESILRRAGYKTGLYTSPHITNFEERFKINGIDIDEADWFDVYKDQEKIINDLGLTFFEVATLMSFEIFKRAAVDYVVFETGMGGRLDATNIITPAVSVITKIALDHQEYLGSDIVTIAGEKLGIVKPGVPVVMLEPENQQIKQQAMDKCAATGSELIFVNTNNVTDISCSNDGVSFEYIDKRYDLSLHGKHQIQNALVALTAISKAVNVDYTIIYDGLKSAAIPGRFQVANINNRTVIFDVAHNPDAARVLVDTIKAVFPDSRVSFVVGMMKDKDIASTIDILSGCAAAFYFAKIGTDRAAAPACLCELTKGKFCGSVTVGNSISDMLRMAVDNANSETDVVCVTGSFYTVAEAYSSIRDVI